MATLIFSVGKILNFLILANIVVMGIKIGVFEDAKSIPGVGVAFRQKDFVTGSRLFRPWKNF